MNRTVQKKISKAKRNPTATEAGGQRPGAKHGDLFGAASSHLESENKYRLLFESNPVPMWVFNLESLRFLAVNDAAVHNYGYSREEFLTMTIREIRPREDTPALLEVIRTLKDGFHPPQPWRHRRKDGSVFDVEIRSHTLTYEGRRADLVMATDVTERRRAQETLARSEQKYRSLFECADDAILIFDPDTEVILEANEKACRMYGFSRTELLGMSLKELTLNVPRGRKQVATLLEHGLCRNFDTVHLNKTRIPIHILANASVIDYQGRKAILSIHRDITERMQAVQALKESEDRYRDLVENSQELICTHDLDGKVLTVNLATARSLACEPGEIVGHNIREFLAPEMQEGFDDYLATIRRDGKAHGLMLVKNFAGEKRVWEYSNTLRTEGVDVPVVRALARDVTERKRAERSARMENRRNEIILRTALDGFLIMDSQGQILEANPAFCQMFGYTPEELRTMRVSDLAAQRTFTEVENLIHEIRARGFATFETTGHCKEGGFIDVEVKSNTIQLDGNELLFSSVRDITERKRNEEQLRELSEFDNQIISSAQEGIVVYDRDLRYRVWNPYMEELSGLRAEEVIGRHPLEILPFLKEQGVYDLLQRALAGQTVVAPDIPQPPIGPKGPGWSSARFSPLRNTKGEIIGVVGIIRDITESKNAEDELQRSRYMLQSVLDTIPQRVFWKDLNSNYVGCNQPFALDAGEEDSKAIVGKSDFELAWKERAALYRADDHEVISTDKSKIHFEERVSHANGRDLWVRTSKVPLHDIQGQVIGILGTYEDITELKRSEMERQAIYEVTEGINQTANLNDLLHLVHEALRRVVYTENIFIALYNKRADHFEFPYWVDQFDPPPNPAQVGKSRTAYVFRTGQPLFLTPEIFRDLNLKGEVEQIGTPSEVWIGVPLKTPVETIGVLVVQHYSDANAYTKRDLEFLTSVGNQIAVAIERKRAEEAIHLQTTRFQSLFENSPIPIAMMDHSDLIIQVNKAFERTFGYMRAEVLGRPINDVVAPPEKKDEAADLSAQTLGGHAIQLETVRRCKDGTLVPVQIFGVPMFSDTGTIGLFALYMDLTESKFLSEQLRQAQKMEAVGRLAGGIAHDFNNLLTAILGYGQLTLGSLDGHDPLRKNVQEIIKAGERAAGLTNQLLAFSRKQVLQPVPLNLNAVVSDMDKMLRRLIGEDVELILKLNAKIGSVRADVGQMGQIIMNLAINSRDAMPHGGKLIIETSNTTFDEVYTRLHPEAIKGSYVMLAITDTGTGMDSDTISHMFEPFFTTKGLGKGTGLGLSTVYGIIKQSDGYVYPYSEVGRGTTFKIYLPRVDGKLDAPIQGEQNADEHPATETILVVEDEMGVRSLIQSVLAAKGYTVLEADDGIEALKLNENHPGTIDLLLTDLVMPRMSGRELAEHLSPKRPEMKVLFMSGYTADSVVYTGALESTLNFIQKPFTTKELSQKITHVLHNDVPDAGPAEELVARN
ncbi:MAG: PAS domain S-box protein [Acidobacteriia bacterium]|nr:PAS domain S-box protein [Terriglobia bacterium]